MSPTLTPGASRRGPALDFFCLRYRNAVAQAAASEGLALLAARKAEVDATWGWALGRWSRQALRWRCAEARLELRLLGRMEVRGHPATGGMAALAGKTRPRGKRFRRAVAARRLALPG